MFLEFDMNVQSSRLAIRRQALYGDVTIEVRDFPDGRLIHEIDNSFLPNGPRISPDGAELAFFGNDSRLYLHGMETGATRLLLENWGEHTGFCEWSPDGESLAFSSCLNRQPPSICCLDVKDGRPFQLTHGPTVDRFPQWSPSGRLVACVRQDPTESGLPMWVYVVDVESKRAVAVPRPEGTGCHVGRFCWTPDSSHIVMVQRREGSACVSVVRREDMETVWTQESGEPQAGAFSPDGHAILCVCRDELLWVLFPEGRTLERLPLTGLAPVRNTLRGPAVVFHPNADTAYFLGEDSRIYQWDIGSGCKPILEETPEPQPDFKHEEYWIASRDGRKIPVHRLIPPNPKPLAVLFVIGGPGGVVSASNSLILRLLAEGFEVIAPAYRGCAGYGGEHLHANIGEYGRADVWDVFEAGWHWKRRFGKDRPLALSGCSYGGYLTLLGLTNPDAPWVCGVALWPCTVVLRHHQQRWFPSDLQQRARETNERNPVAQATRIRYPLLMFHGGLDTTSSNEDVSLIQQRVQSQGVPCELVIFEDDTHGLNRHREEMFRHMFDFVARFAS